MYTRLLTISSEQQSSAFLFGPRGTGKTTWLKTHFPKALYFDLLQANTYRELSANPELLGNRIPPDFQDWVIIDEIQKLPELLDMVHHLIEARKLRFVLTGSSARKLRRSGVNLLAGRALTYYLHPLTSIELGSDFNVQQALLNGHLPAVIHHENPEHYLKSYISTYLTEEVKEESLVRNIPLFSRFMEIACFSQGEVLNYTEIAREVGSNRHTITGFFEILHDLLISCTVPVFTKRAKRALISQSKFYYFDPGVYRVLRPMGPIDTHEEADGPALETLFLQELRAINDYFNFDYNIYFWRTQSKIEVDFVIYGKQGFYAFEIKRKSSLKNSDFKGLKLFSEDYPEAQCYMLYGGERSYFENNIHVVPFVEALTKLKAIIGK